MQLCDYGCGQEAKYQFKNGKWCCSESYNSCKGNKNKKSKTMIGMKQLPPVLINEKNKLCDYGCGRKALYRYKNGKYCCSISRNKCPFLKQKNKELNKDRKPWNDGLKDCFSEEYLKRKSESMSGEKHWNYKKHLSEETKKKIGDGNRNKVISIEQRRKQSIAMSGENNFWYGKKNIFSKESMKKQNESKRITIEKINKKYPFFSKIEEMRYNPDNLIRKEIQVHCKNHNCKNSKEKGGWFTPLVGQIIQRRRALELPEGNDGGYFYCSQECRNECCLYKLRGDPLLKSKFEKYKNIVYKETNKTLRLYHIKNIELRSKEYPLDHKYSIYQGFINNVDPRWIAYRKNLEIVPLYINSSKQDNCSILLSELEKIYKNPN
jgi:hypothetical protein